MTTLIAVIDSGVDLSPSNPDLPYYDFTHAYDAQAKEPASVHGPSVVGQQSAHGPMVAKTIVEGIKDAKAQAGARDVDVKIMPIRVANGDGAMRAIYWAVDHGASVINLSQQYSSEPRLWNWDPALNGAWLHNAIKYAEDHGVVFVSAAGNDAVNVDLYAKFPPQSDNPAFYSSSTDPVPTNLVIAAAYDGATSLGTVPVNQQLAPTGSYDGSFSYKSLDQSFLVTSGTLKVKLTNAGIAAGYLVTADIVRINRVGNPPGGAGCRSPSRRTPRRRRWRSTRSPRPRPRPDDPPGPGRIPCASDRAPRSPRRPARSVPGAIRAGPCGGTSRRLRPSTDPREIEPLRWRASCPPAGRWCRPGGG